MGLTGALSELIPSHVIIYPQSSYQALRYLEGLSAPLTRPTILCIDECTTFTANKLQQLLFVTSPDGTLLMKKLPTNLFVYICIYRTLLESTTQTLLTQRQLSLVKQSTNSNSPSLIELPRPSLKDLSTTLYTLLEEGREGAEPPCKLSYIPYEACYLYVKNNDISSIWAAATNFLFYHPLHITGNHATTARPPFIQLIRSFLTSSYDDTDLLLIFGNNKNMMMAIEANKRLSLNYLRGTTISFDDLLLTPYIPLKRQVLDMYDEAISQGISSQTVVRWLYDYIYDAYNHPAALRYLLDMFSFLTSISGHYYDNLPRPLIAALLQALSTAKHMRKTLKPVSVRNSSFLGTIRTSRSKAEVYPILAHLIITDRTPFPVNENGDTSDVSD